MGRRKEEESNATSRSENAADSRSYSQGNMDGGGKRAYRVDGKRQSPRGGAYLTLFLTEVDTGVRHQARVYRGSLGEYRTANSGGRAQGKGEQEGTRQPAVLESIDLATLEPGSTIRCTSASGSEGYNLLSDVALLQTPGERNT